LSVDSSASMFLSKHLQFLVKLLEERLLRIAGSGFDPRFMFVGLNADSSRDFARRFFGDGRFKVFAVDGSMAQEEHLEMLLFHVCSLGCYGLLKVGVDGVEVNVRDVKRDEALTLTASVPLWLEDLPNVNPQATYASEDYYLSRSIESIPYALMRLSELTVAYRLTQQPDVRVILMDGSLSGVYGPLMRDFRLLMRGSSVFEGLKTPYGSISKADVVLAGNLGPYPYFIPNRGVFSKYHCLKHLLDKDDDGWIPVDELKSQYSSFNRVYAGLKRLNDRLSGGLLELKDGGKHVRVRPELKDYWDRVWWATSRLADRIFEGKDEYPLLLDEDRWITVLDVNAMNLFTLYNLLSEAVRRRVLVVGVAKDTSATDFVRSLMPTLLHIKGVTNDFEGLPVLQSDKATLTMLSSISHDKLPTPWRTIEYDYCFATLISKIVKGELNIKAARRIIGREQTFVKSYFQLRSLSLDSSMRSPVFCYDRPLYPEYDECLLSTLEAQEYRAQVQIHPLIEVEKLSSIGNFVLHLLSLSDNPYVIEEDGYNHLLFLVDKYVKALSKQAGEALRGIASLGLGRIVNKYKAYFVAKRFRDLRAEVERLREVRGVLGVKPTL